MSWLQILAVVLSGVATVMLVQIAREEGGAGLWTVAGTAGVLMLMNLFFLIEDLGSL